MDLIPTSGQDVELSGPGIVTGTVTDQFGDPLSNAGVTVWLSGEFISGSDTNWDGSFEIGGLPLTELVLRAEFYDDSLDLAPAQISFELSTDDPETVVDVELTEGGTLVGSVSQADTLQPLGDVTVLVLDADSHQIVAREWLSGHADFVIGRLPSGDYLVKLMVSPVYGATVEQDVQLTAAGGNYWTTDDPTGTSDVAEASRITVESGAVVSGIDMQLGVGSGIVGVVKVSTLDGPVTLPARRELSVLVERFVNGSWVPQEESMGGTDGYALGGFFAVTGLAEGHYRVTLHDSTFGNRALVDHQFEVDTVAGQLTDVGEKVLEIAVPTTAPSATDLAQLDERIVQLLNGLVGAPEEAEAGDEITISVGAQYAGEWIGVTANSTPTLLGSWVQVGADGTVSVAVPRDLTGSHRLVVQDADAFPMGWSSIELAPAAEGTDDTDGDTGESDGGETGSGEETGNSDGASENSGGSQGTTGGPTAGNPGSSTGGNARGDQPVADNSQSGIDSAPDDEAAAEDGAAPEADAPAPAPNAEADTAEEADDALAVQEPAADDSSAWIMWVIIGGVVLLVLLAVGGFALARRRA